MLVALISGTGYCGTGPSYDDTVAVIKETMIGNTSVARQESYGYVTFDKCTLTYNVSGIYPVGDPYTITFSGIDFSALNYDLSKTGRDYSAFVILNFDRDIKFKDDFKELTVNTIVINMFNDEAAHKLFNASLQLGELCGAPKGSRQHPVP
jgi:hypothetical protein